MALSTVTTIIYEPSDVTTACLNGIPGIIRNENSNENSRTPSENEYRQRTLPLYELCILFIFYLPGNERTCAKANRPDSSSQILFILVHDMDSTFSPCSKNLIC